MRQTWTRVLLSLTVMLLAATAMPNEGAAQALDCWTCNAETECVHDGWGTGEPCNYQELCIDGDCWWTCLLGGGEICDGEPEAVAMSGQVVLPIDLESNAAQSLLSSLSLDAEAGVYRRSCDKAAVVLDAGVDASRPVGSPAPRIVLR